MRPSVRATFLSRLPKAWLLSFLAPALLMGCAQHHGTAKAEAKQLGLKEAQYRKLKTDAEAGDKGAAEKLARLWSSVATTARRRSTGSMWPPKTAASARRSLRKSPSRNRNWRRSSSRGRGNGGEPGAGSSSPSSSSLSSSSPACIGPASSLVRRSGAAGGHPLHLPNPAEPERRRVNVEAECRNVRQFSFECVERGSLLSLSERRCRLHFLGCCLRERRPSAGDLSTFSADSSRERCSRNWRRQPRALGSGESRALHTIGCASRSSAPLPEGARQSGYARSSLSEPTADEWEQKDGDEEDDEDPPRRGAG